MSLPEAERTPSHRPSRTTAAPLVWFTGLSGAGKSTLARAVKAALDEAQIDSELLDADVTRAHLSRGLGFSRADREENVRRLAFVAGLLTSHRVVTLVAAMSPYRAGRDAVREQSAHFIEIYVDAPLSLCEQRDPVGLYRRFRAGEITQLSGLDEPYEVPLAPEVHCETAQSSLNQCTAAVLAVLLPLLV